MIVNQTPVLVPVIVYITVLDHNWVIMRKQRFPVALAAIIIFIEALYITRYSLSRDSNDVDLPVLHAFSDFFSLGLG